MSIYFCHECSINIGLLNDEIKDFNPSGSEYQLRKFFKHTVPPNRSSTISIFDISKNKKYKDYFVNTLASGCVEIDNQCQKDIVWFAGKKQGYRFVDTVLQGDDDGVKIVLPNDPEHIHAYPISSAGLSTEKCVICGKNIVI